MSALRLKMRVESVKKTRIGDGATCDQIVLSAATGFGNENWSKWTPSGTLVFDVTNPDAQDKLQPGMYAFVDITPVTH